MRHQAEPETKPTRTTAMYRCLMALTLAAGLFMIPQAHSPAAAQPAESYDRFIGPEPEAFDDPAALVEAFKSRLAVGDKEGLAKLLGLNLAEASATEDFDERLAEVRDAAAKGIRLEDAAPDRRLLLLGDQVWPFPFPAVSVDGKWSFDTIAGLEEVINRRIGENELQAIATARAYVAAQEVYKQSDWDEDGVLEYAQNLISTPETYDGLYWPSGGRVPVSPAGPYVAQAGLEPDPNRESGYFGYRFRILKGQGDNVAGDKYDYVINGNMIAGFALIAWPATYDETGIMTFMVSHHGTVYEKDLGPETSSLVEKIAIFDPDDTWSVVKEPTQ